MRVISRQFVSQARTATRFGVINDIRRKGVVYVINKTDPRFKAKQG